MTIIQKPNVLVTFKLVLPPKEEKFSDQNSHSVETPTLLNDRGEYSCNLLSLQLPFDFEFVRNRD